MTNLLTELFSAISPAQLLLVWGVVVFAAVMRAFTGFGFALTAVPVFALFMPPTQAVVLSASLTLAVSLLTLKTYWGKYPLRPMFPMLLLSGIGTAVGAASLTLISPEQFKLWVGLSVILACIGLTFYKPSQQKSRPVVAGATGLASGLMNGAFAIPGPPVIIYAMATEATPERSRALLMTFFLFSAVVGLASYATAGFVNEASPWLFMLAFPAMFVGDKLGYRLFNRYGTDLYRRVALVVLFAVGASITANAMLG
jgi:uncharacterized membrane protein YfcA